MAKNKTTATINAIFKIASIPVHLGSGDESNDAGQISVLAFETGNEAFAVTVENVEGVVDCPRITPLPNPPDGVVGVASVRGRMTLVMCMNSNGSQPENRQGEGKRRLILLKGDSQLGLFADRIEDVLSFSGKDLHEASGRKAKNSPEAIGERNSTAYFTHKGRKIPIIDFERLTGA